MLIIPKKGYRVCLDCGRVMQSNMLRDDYLDGKKVSCCYFCKSPEKISTGNEILDEYTAEKYFFVLEQNAALTKSGFGLSETDRQTIEHLYDTYGIPEGLRIYG